MNEQLVLHDAASEAITYVHAHKTSLNCTYDMSSSSSSSLNKSSSDDDDHQDQLRRGPWTLEEDTLLVHSIACHGEGRWNSLALLAGLRRTGKSCRLRWLNYLKPDVKRGNLTPQEQLLILDLHSKLGNRWSKIAQHLPGRTDNEIKNYWRTQVQKQAKSLKMDVNSTAFQDIIRLVWIPKLLQKIPGSTSSVPPPPSSLLPTPVPGEEISGQRDNLEDHSDSERGFNSCISSTDRSLNIISQIFELSECQQASTNGSNCVTDCCFDFETMNIATVSLAEGFENTVGDCPVAKNEWVGCDFGDSYVWGMDEFMEI